MPQRHSSQPVCVCVYVYVHCLVVVPLWLVICALVQQWQAGDVHGAEAVAFRCVSHGVRVRVR